MKEECEIQEQYNISKAILLMFLKSQPVIQIVGEEGSIDYGIFLCNHVLVHEDEY